MPFYQHVKMTTILNDTTKFLDLGPVTNKDNTAKIESRIQRRLLQLRKECLISKQVYEAIRPTGSQRPRIYGIPKIHKTDVALRSILSIWSVVDFVYLEVALLFAFLLLKRLSLNLSIPFCVSKKNSSTL